MIENKQREVVLIADSFGFLKNFAISDTRLRPPFFPIREIVRPVELARRSSLASDQRNFLIGTAKLSEFPLTTRETNHLTFSNRDRFFSLPFCAALRANPSSFARSPLVTSHSLALRNEGSLPLTNRVSMGNKNSTQPTQNKQSDPFLIEFFRHFFRSSVRFRHLQPVLIDMRRPLLARPFFRLRNLLSPRDLPISISIRISRRPFWMLTRDTQIRETTALRPGAESILKRLPANATARLPAKDALIHRQASAVRTNNELVDW